MNTAATFKIYPMSEHPVNTFSIDFSSFNPLGPNSDLHQISHCGNKGLSVREVMTTEDMMPQVKINYLAINFKNLISNLVLGLKGKILAFFFFMFSDKYHHWGPNLA